MMNLITQKLEIMMSSLKESMDDKISGNHIGIDAWNRVANTIFLLRVNLMITIYNLTQKDYNGTDN